MSESTERRLLLLTATIRPSDGTARLVRADPALRREDYRRAVDRYARLLPPARWALALVENSGSEVEDLQALAAAQGHELLVLRTAPAPDGSGKGNGEALMLDSAEEQLRQRGLAFRQVAKITGRLVVTNLERALPLPEGPHIAARMHRDRSMADTRVIAFDQATWHRHLRGLTALVREPEGRYLEHAVALRIAEALYAGPTTWQPFRREPAVAGVSGTDGIRYDSTRSRLTRYAKDALMRLPAAEYR